MEALDVRIKIADLYDRGLMAGDCTSSTMLYIMIDAYLDKKDTDDEWVHIRTASKTCFVSKTCTAERTIDNPAYGDYQLMYCFNAFSTGSRWAYSCLYAEYEIP
ncbi:MAG: hypothetical protein OXE87_16640 [Chloroflexi bacterium]|nr:hypothetical protein [Chloroflexota bacterium]